MGCHLSLKNNSQNYKKEAENAEVVIKKETIDIIQDSWKKYSAANTLAEHGINMVIRYKVIQCNLILFQELLFNIYCYLNCVKPPL